MDVDPTFDEKVLKLIAEAVPGKLKKGGIAKEMRLRDLGLDSLGMAAMVFRLEEAFDVCLDDIDLGINPGQMRTVEDAISVSREIVRRARVARD